MKFYLLTLFPEMCEGYINGSILGRAIKNDVISVDTVNIRDYSSDKHKSVDDYPYGGGAGMLMQAEPVYNCYEALFGKKKIRTVYVTPTGEPFTQKMAKELSKEDELCLLCGHYEGIDDRVLDEIVTDYVSIGDYVLTGGELPAMVIIDAVARLVPGVLNNDESAVTESFHNDLLEYPQYSRPPVFHGVAVPEVLLSGNHEKIEEWRLRESIKITKKRRPDLYEKYMAKIKIADKLLKDRKKSKHISECLKSGFSEILYYETNDQKKDICVLYDTVEKIVLSNSFLLDSKVYENLPSDVVGIVFSYEEEMNYFLETFKRGVEDSIETISISGSEITNKGNLKFVKFACK